MKACLFCNKEISMPLSLSFIFSFKKLRQPLVCNSCLKAFNPIDLKSACSGCARTKRNTSLCSDCEKWKARYPELKLNHKALFTYNELAKEYMKQLKFQGDLVLAQLFNEKINQTLKSYQKTHHIVPIPISKESMQARGFNQVKLMLEKSEINYENWLSHIGDGQRQASKNRKERLQSKQFLIIALEPSEFEKINKPILIVDDVYTTGRTILHAKKAFHHFNRNAGNINNKIVGEKTLEIDSFSIFR